MVVAVVVRIWKIYVEISISQSKPGKALWLVQLFAFIKSNVHVICLLQLARSLNCSSNSDLIIGSIKATPTLFLNFSNLKYTV